MSPKKDICENIVIIEDNIELEVTMDAETFHVLIEGREYKVIKKNKEIDVFQKINQSDFFVMLRTKEEEKLAIQAQINQQEYDKKHCNEQHAQAKRMPCPLPREEVIKLFKSVGLTPPSADSSICNPSEIS